MADAELTELELKIALMWENGADTLDISRAVGMPANLTEADVYAMLPGVRSKRKRQREVVIR